MNKYSKFIVSLVGAVLVAATQLYPTNKYVVMAVAFATALGVYQVRNSQ